MCYVLLKNRLPRLQKSPSKTRSDHPLQQIQKMFYRTNLWVHSNRISWIVEELIPLAEKTYPGFDANTARTMSHIHDDHEIILGDIMLGDKINMSKNQHVELHEREKQAIRDTAKLFPKKINGYDYQELLLRYQDYEEFLSPSQGKTLEDPEACIVRFADKFEGFGEALHEIHAGNTVFTDGFSEITDSPIDVYTKIFNEFDQMFPIFSKMRIHEHPLLEKPINFDFQETAKLGKPHTRESVLDETAVPYYNAWKEISIKYGGDYGIELLIKKIE